MSLRPPASGLIAMRIGLEFGRDDAFATSAMAAAEQGGERGATLVAVLDRGDLAIHIPGVGEPAWNVVPLLSLRATRAPEASEWDAANAILEKLERYR